MKRIKELKRPSGPYNMSLRDIGYNEAIDDVLKILSNYRDAEEVRKETAKEILNDLCFNLKSSVQGKASKSNDYYNVLGWIEELAIEYGVEVEE